MDWPKLNDNTVIYLRIASILMTTWGIMDKFDSIKAFIAVVDAGGFAAAARQMGMTRSAVNKLVHNLEDSLGTQLLRRSTRKVAVTETGMVFYERCVQVMADLEEAEQEVTQLQAEPRGTLKINAPMSFGTLHLAPALAKFMQRYPRLRVQLMLNDRFVDPLEEGFDITLRIAELPISSSLMVHPLLPAPRILCAAPAYLKRRGSPSHPRELRQHSCLHYDYLATGGVWRLSGPDGDHTLRVKGVLCSNNAEVLKTAAMQGLGIALVPLFIAAQDLHQQRLQVVLPEYHPPEIVISMVYPPSRHLSTKIRVFREFLQEHLSNSQDPIAKIPQDRWE